MAPFLRRLSVLTYGAGYVGLMVAHRHDPGVCAWYGLILIGVVFHLLPTRRSRDEEAY